MSLIQNDDIKFKKKIFVQLILHYIMLKLSLVSYYGLQINGRFLIMSRVEK